MAADNPPAFSDLTRKDVTWLRYAGQGHGFTGMAIKDFTARELGYFDRYLKAGTGVK
jgi:hypothetical protein